MSAALETRDFPALVREHGAGIWRALRRLGVRDADVPDLAQEVFVVFHRKAHEFEGRSDVRTYLYGIALRVASDYRKSAYVRHEQRGHEVPERSGSAPELKELERKERLRLLDRALGTLDEKKREVLVLFEIEEVSMKEIAMLLDCPEKTAYGRLYAAREELRRALLSLDPEGALR